MKIIKATTEHTILISPIFNDYRKFYEQESDLQGATQFLQARLEQQQSVIFFAQVDEHCVGFTQLYPTFSSIGMQKAYILNDLYVDENFRRHNIAKSLMNAAFEFAKSENARYVTLETAYTNTKAQALYEKIGMTTDTEMKHYFIYF